MTRQRRGVLMTVDVVDYTTQAQLNTTDTPAFEKTLEAFTRELTEKHNGLFANETATPWSCSFLKKKTSSNLAFDSGTHRWNMK